MNFASTLPQTKADFFDEKGLLKEYRPPAQQQTVGMFILRKVPIIPGSVSDSVSDPTPSPDFPFLEFPLTEVVNQSQIDSSSISDMLHPGKTSNSTRKAPPSTDFSLKSVQNSSPDEEMAVLRDPIIAPRLTQSTRDSSTISISDNSNPRKSISGIMTDTPMTFSVETDVPERELSNNRSVMPTDVQALTVLQDLISDDFQAKNTHSTQRKGEDGTNEAFQLIQKIHNQLQQVQFDLQRLHSLHKYKN